MFCCNCGQQVVDGGNFCSHCGKEFFSNGIASQSQSSSSAVSVPPSSAAVTTSNSCVPLSSASGTVIKSFSAYRKNKGSQWKERVKKDVKKEKEEEVAVAIGLMEFNEKESRLKPLRGKRVMLRISNKAPYSVVRAQAEAKFKAYHSNCYKEGEEYRLLFESGKDAQFLPGTTEFFSLKRYREEIGKDYKSIVLYLCTNEDVNTSENPDGDCDDSLHSEDEHAHPSSKKPRLAKVTEEDTGEGPGQSDENSISNQIESDEILARQLQSQLDNTEEPTIDIQSTSGENMQESTVKSLSQEKMEKFYSCHGLIAFLKERVNRHSQFFTVVRRGSGLQRFLKIWQREANKNSPEKILRVHFAGEDGIDTGAMSKEFLTLATDQIRSEMFPHGAPTDSMLYAHKGFFYTSAQISLASIVQGGPPPCLFEDCVYNMLVNQEVDMSQLTAEHLTKHENELISRIRSDPVQMQDTILDHGYTGTISFDHLDTIIGTIILSIVSKRLFYLKEFRRGLDQYGFLEALQHNADLCRELFILNQDKVDANYVVSLLRPQFSEEGTSKRLVEETVFDNLHDFILTSEDTKLTGYMEELAYDDKDTEDGEDEEHETEHHSQVQSQSADISPQGLLGWLTGQRHRPIDGDKLLITVRFDHECLQREPNHTICFPIVGACGRNLTLPVSHMQDEEEFKKIMLLAFCKGQAFGKR